METNDSRRDEMRLINRVAGKVAKANYLDMILIQQLMKVNLNNCHIILQTFSILTGLINAHKWSDLKRRYTNTITAAQSQIAQKNEIKH